MAGNKWWLAAVAAAGMSACGVGAGPDDGLPAFAGVSSTFDQGDDGWRLTGDPATQGSAPQFVATGGNPDGYISAVDAATGESLYFVAPQKFHGDVSPAQGRTLRFDAMTDETNLQTPGRLVVLEGADRVIYFDSDQVPGTTWTHFSVPLDVSGNWKHAGSDAAVSAEELEAVLTGLTALRIRADFRVGGETVGLDNVQFGTDVL